MFDLVGRVEKNTLFGSYGHLFLSFPGRHISVAPGQFAMLRPHGAFEPLLRRAMAVYRVAQTKDETQMEFIYQVFGRGTEVLQRLLPGQFVDCLGPLGKPYDLSPVMVGSREALLIAGGVGSAGLFLLAEALIKQSVSVRLFFGGRSTIDLVGLDDFVRLGCKVHLATNDGTRGVKGFVTDPFLRFLIDNAQDVQAGKYVVYCCGPTPMMKRVADIAGEMHVLAYASLEERMACGFGVCVGCVTEVRCNDSETDYLRICVEGPIFRCDQLVWD